MFNWLLLSMVVIIIWEVLLRLIPAGLLLAPINILFMVLSFAIGAFGYLPILRKRMNSILAYFSAVILWFIVFVVIRSLIFPAK